MISHLALAPVLVLLKGALVTVQLTVQSAPLALVVAFGLGTAKVSRFLAIRACASVIVEVFRGTSLLVQLFILFYFLPLFGIRLDPVETGILGLGLNFGAYGAEIVRGAILNVDRGQHDATVALNMTPFLAMRRVIIPQALFVMLPSFGNLIVELLKATSLTSFITISELSFDGRVLVQTTNRTGEIYTLVLVIYLILSLPLVKLTSRLESWTSRGLHVGRADV